MGRFFILFVAAAGLLFDLVNLIATRCEAACCFGSGQIQRHWTADEALKAKMFMEPESDFIFSVDNQREDGWLGPHGARDRIDDKLGAKPLTANLPIHAEPAGQGMPGTKDNEVTVGVVGRKFGLGEG